jgi:hypothetical protein
MPDYVRTRLLDSYYGREPKSIFGDDEDEGQGYHKYRHQHLSVHVQIRVVANVTIHSRRR